MDVRGNLLPPPFLGLRNVRQLLIDKGGLISKSFSTWPQKCAKHNPEYDLVDRAQDSYLALFWGDWS